jgi:hypothetical protein
MVFQAFLLQNILVHNFSILLLFSYPNHLPIYFNLFILLNFSLNQSFILMDFNFIKYQLFNLFLLLDIYRLFYLIHLFLHQNQTELSHVKLFLFIISLFQLLYLFFFIRSLSLGAFSFQIIIQY